MRSPGELKAAAHFAAAKCNRQHEGHGMQILKLICQVIGSLVKQAWCLPQTIGSALKQRRRQIILDEAEAERLDRIRNPSKYLGK